MNTIDKIRAEIERRKKYQLEQFNKKKPDGRLNDGWAESLAIMGELEEFLSFLDTLEPVSDDLEEAAEKKYPVYWKNYPKDGIVRSESSYDTNKQCRDAFKAGAEWQEKQDLGWAGEIHKNGYNLCKEQMMEGAVEGEICGRIYDHINVRFADGICKYLEPKNISHIPADVSKYNIGDKVRIIVVKEDGQ